LILQEKRFIFFFILFSITVATRMYHISQPAPKEETFW